MDKKEQLVGILAKLMPDVKFDDAVIDEFLGFIEGIANERCDSLASELGVERKKVADKDQELETMDTEHAEALQDVSDKLEEHYKAELEKQTKLIKEQTEQSMAVKLSKFHEDVLAESMPVKETVDRNRLMMLESVFGDMREKLMVTDEFIKAEVKEAVVEARKLIESKDREINNILVENASLKKAVNLVETKTLIEEKTKDMPAKKSAYVRNFLKECTNKGEVEQKINEAVTAYDKDEESTRQKLINENKNTPSRPLALPKVKKEEVITEVKTQIDPMDIYVESFHRIANPLEKRG